MTCTFVCHPLFVQCDDSTFPMGSFDSTEQCHVETWCEGLAYSKQQTKDGMACQQVCTCETTRGHHTLDLAGPRIPWYSQMPLLPVGGHVHRVASPGFRLHSRMPARAEHRGCPLLLHLVPVLVCWPRVSVFRYIQILGAMWYPSSPTLLHLGILG